MVKRIANADNQPVTEERIREIVREEVDAALRRQAGSSASPSRSNATRSAVTSA